MTARLVVAFGLAVGMLAGFAAWAVGVFAADLVAAGVAIFTIAAFYPHPRS